MRKLQHISVRVDFEGEDADKLNFLLKKRGLKKYAELARQLITEATQRLEVPAQ